MDRKAELERKKAKLEELRKEKERRRQEKEKAEVLKHLISNQDPETAVLMLISSSWKTPIESSEEKGTRMSPAWTNC